MLTETIKQQVLELHDSGHKNGQIAKQLKLHHTQIARIIEHRNSVPKERVYKAPKGIQTALLTEIRDLLKQLVDNSK